jgi:hypothetical protein
MLADEPEAPDAIADDDDDAMGDDEVGAAAGVLDEDEVHAAAPTARLAAIPDTASKRTFFTGFSLLVFLFDSGFRCGDGWNA